MPEANEPKDVKDAKETKECDGFEVEGIVKEILPGGMYRVELEGGPSVIAYVCGRMRKNYIRIVMGDRVRVAFSPYGPQRGRIVYRSR